MSFKAVLGDFEWKILVGDIQDLRFFKLFFFKSPYKLFEVFLVQKRGELNVQGAW